MINTKTSIFTPYDDDLKTFTYQVQGLFQLSTPKTLNLATCITNTMRLTNGYDTSFARFYGFEVKVKNLRAEVAFASNLYTAQSPLFSILPAATHTYKGTSTYGTYLPITSLILTVNGNLTGLPNCTAVGINSIAFTVVNASNFLTDNFTLAVTNLGGTAVSSTEYIFYDLEVTEIVAFR